MKSDISRSTFNSKKHYRAVRMQQGRPQLDSDWNEQIDIENHLRRTVISDLMGQSGVPLKNDGFHIEETSSGENVKISKGRIYVDGILCENNSDVYYQKIEGHTNEIPQEIIPLDSEVDGDGTYLVYLETREYNVGRLEDPDLLEVALGGVDSTTRTQILNRVRMAKIGNRNLTDYESKVDEKINSLIEKQKYRGTINIATRKDQNSVDLCKLGVQGGYSGQENLLYRIEIHQGGSYNNATFKWSRWNAAFETEWLEQDEDVLIVQHAGEDQIIHLAPGQWIELTDEVLERQGERGTLAQILKVEGESITINKSNIILHAPLQSVGLDIESFTGKVKKLRLWGMEETGGQITSKDLPVKEFYNNWSELEYGIEIKFNRDVNDNGTIISSSEFQSGDYWFVPARVLTRNVQWESDENGDSVPLSPFGTTRHYAPLALVDRNNSLWSVLHDLRTPLGHLVYIGGDGQEAKPDNELVHPLSLRVMSAVDPIKGASVLFKIIDGNGQLSVTSGGTYSQSVKVETDLQGYVNCFWKLGVSVNPDQQTADKQSVIAILLNDEGEELPAYFKFGANLSLADEVHYNRPSMVESTSKDGLNSDLMNGVDTVQEGLDRLNNIKVNRSGDTITGPLNLESTLSVNGQTSLHDNVQIDQNINVDGTADFNNNVNISGNLLVKGEMIVRDVEHQAGDVQLGDNDNDQIIFHGALLSKHSSDSLIIKNNTGINTTDPGSELEVNSASRRKRSSIGASTQNHDNYLVMSSACEGFGTKKFGDSRVYWKNGDLHLGISSDYKGESFQKLLSLSNKGQLVVGDVKPEIKEDHKVAVDGGVIASYFIGDGSKLTGIKNGKWDDGRIVNSIHYSKGNVGIGINTPKETLHVADNARFDKNIYTHSGVVAEYYESANGSAIPLGTTVVFEEDGKIRAAKRGEVPFGVISATPAIVGGVFAEWPEKYVKDGFGNYVYEIKEVEIMKQAVETITEERQKTEIKTIAEEVVSFKVVEEGGKFLQKRVVETVNKEVEEPLYKTVELYSNDGLKVIGSYRVPEMEIVTHDVLLFEEDGSPKMIGTGEFESIREKKINPEFDPTLTYVSRLERAEWNCVGFIGQLPVRTGQPVGENWVLVKSISDRANLYLLK